MDKLRDEAIKLNNDEDFVKFLPDEVEDRLLKNSFIQVGYEDGIKHDIEKNTIELTKNMLKENASIDFISKVTGLSFKKISRTKTLIFLFKLIFFTYLPPKKHISYNIY